MSGKTSRRSVLKYIATAVGGLVVGGVAGWSAKPIPTPPMAKFGEAPPAGTQVTIVHGFDAAYPPFTKVDPTGKAVGFDVDMVNAIADKYGWTVVEKPWDWSAIIAALNNGDLDIIASGMSVTAKRSAAAVFGLPYYSYVHHLLVLATEKRSEKEILNSGQFISFQLGSSADNWVTKLLDAGNKFQKLGLDSYQFAFEAVLDGRAVAVMSDEGFTAPYFKANPDIAAKFRVLTNVGGLAVYAIATRTGDKWLRDQINLELEDMMGTPGWDDLIKKWNLET